MEKETKKDKMFQYYVGTQKVENTDLIDMTEALNLWEKYLPQVKALLKEGDHVQMCIWMDCQNNSNYSIVYKEIDYRDCQIEHGKVYKITKEFIA